MNDRYLHSQMHEMIVVVADKYLEQLKPEEIVCLAPQDYGPEVTDDHKNFIWDKFYDDISCMEPMDIYRMYQMYIKERLNMREAIVRAEAARLMNNQLLLNNIAINAAKKKQEK